MKRRALFAVWCFAAPASAQERHCELSNNRSGATKEYVARDCISLKPGFSYAATAEKSFVGRIDQMMVTPPTEGSYKRANGNTTSNPAQGAAAGTLAGRSDVNRTGAATYTVPVEVPTGVADIQPSLSLIYNSQTGNGIAGWGFNTGGLSAITRVPRTLYSDGVADGLKYSGADVGGKNSYRQPANRCSTDNQLQLQRCQSAFARQRIFRIWRSNDTQYYAEQQNHRRI